MCLETWRGLGTAKTPDAAWRLWAVFSGSDTDPSFPGSLSHTCHLPGLEHRASGPLTHFCALLGLQPGNPSSPSACDAKHYDKPQSPSSLPWGRLHPWSSVLERLRPAVQLLPCHEWSFLPETVADLTRTLGNHFLTMPLSWILLLSGRRLFLKLIFIYISLFK